MHVFFDMSWPIKLYYAWEPSPDPIAGYRWMIKPSQVDMGAANSLASSPWWPPSDLGRRSLKTLGEDDGVARIQLNPTESNWIQPNPTLQFWSFINFLGSLLFDVGISLKVKLVHDATSPGGVLVPRIQRHEGLQLALARLQCWQWICKIDSLPDSLPDSVDA